MSFLEGDFPGIDSYRADLGWIIKKIKEFDSWNEIIQELQETLENLPNIINKEVAKQLQPYIDNINNKLDGFQNVLDGYGDRITAVENHMMEIEQMYMELLKWVSQLYGFIESYTDLVGERVFAQLKAYIDEWSKDLPPVICPVDGNLEPISVALMHLYNFYNRGITAEKYDSLQITAKEYNDFKITARDYDAFGNDYFENIYACMMISPFTGEMEYISDVVVKLADFHKKGITAEAYDELDKTAQDYDDAEISAYSYDWNNPLNV